MAEILVVFFGQRHFDILKGEQNSFAKPLLGEYLLISIGTSIYLHIFCLIIIISMTYLIHLRNKMPANRRATEVSKGLDGKTPPLLRVGKQLKVFTKGIMCRNSIKAIYYLRVFCLQPLCLLHIIVGGIKREDIDI